MAAPAVPRLPTAAEGVDLYLEADAVHYEAARIQTAVGLLEEVLGEAFTGDKEANLVLRDALVLFLRDVSAGLEAEARGAMKGKESLCWTKAVCRRQLEGLRKED
jgi:hypothetical protein